MSIYWKKKNRGSVPESWEVNSQCSLKFCCTLVLSSVKQRTVTAPARYGCCEASWRTDVNYMHVCLWSDFIYGSTENGACYARCPHEAFPTLSTLLEAASWHFSVIHFLTQCSKDLPLSATPFRKLEISNQAPWVYDLCHHVGLNSWLIILKFLIIFFNGTLHFNFALGPAKLKLCSRS